MFSKIIKEQESGKHFLNMLGCQTSETIMGNEKNMNESRGIRATILYSNLKWLPKNALDIYTLLNVDKVDCHL